MRPRRKRKTGESKKTFIYDYVIYGGVGDIMRNKELWVTLLSFAVMSFIAGMVAGLILSHL